MQKIVCLWVCLVGLAWPAHAQNAASACGNGRCVKDIFASGQTPPDLVLGSNTVRNYATDTQRDPMGLRFDEYEPQGDAAVRRPLLLAFGSPFVSGARTDAEVVSFCGTNALQPQATAVGILNQRHPIVNGSPGTEPEFTQLSNGAAEFLQPLICAAPLPATLTSFSGRVASDDCTATLTWQTATEHNSYAYEVQGSADGEVYGPLSTVPSRNRAAGATYSFRIGRLAELHYFRLRMLDIGGAAAYSPVVTLAGCAPGPLLVAPTPTRDQATVSGLPAGRCLGLLYSATGQLVTQASGTATISLRLGNLAPGIYLLKVQSESGAALGTAKVVKE